MFSHLTWMLFIMKVNEFTDPIDVMFLSGVTVVFVTNYFTDSRDKELGFLTHGAACVDKNN